MIEFTKTVAQNEKATLSPLFEKALKYFPDLEDKKILVSTTKKFTGVCEGAFGLCEILSSKSFKITLLFNKKLTPSLNVIGHELMHIQLENEGLESRGIRGEYLCDARIMCLNEIFHDGYPIYLIGGHENIIKNWEKYAQLTQYICELSLAKSAKSISNGGYINISWLRTQFCELDKDKLEFL